MYDVVVRMMGVSGHTRMQEVAKQSIRRLIRLEDLRILSTQNAADRVF